MNFQNLNLEKISIQDIEKYVSDNEIQLAPTQHQLCVPIILRIYQKMIHDLKFDDIKVFDNLIIDGHHRYISSLLARKTIGQVSTLKTTATRIYQWREVQFVDIEWDTKEKIEKLNVDDAEFNAVPLARIYEMMK